MTIARLAPAHAARSQARPRAATRLLALSADACACTVLSAVIPLALIYGTAGKLRPPGFGLPAMAAAVPAAAAVIGRTGRDWEVLVAGVAAMGLAGLLGDVARSVPLTELAAPLRGAGAGLALAGAVAFARARCHAGDRGHARASVAGSGAVPLRWWWAAMTVSAVVCAPVLEAGPVTGGRTDMLTIAALAGQTVVVVTLAGMAARRRARRRTGRVFLLLAVVAGCTLTVAGSLMLDRRTLPLAAAAAIAAAAFAARRPAAGVGGILLTGGVLAYLLAASPSALTSGLPAALLTAVLAAALSGALSRGAFGTACLAPPPATMYLKTYAVNGASVRYPGASRTLTAWPAGHHLVTGAVVLVCGILVGYLTVGVLQGSGYSGAVGNIYVVHR